MTALPPRDEATKLLSEGSVPLGLYATLLLPAEEAAIKAANDSNVIYARIVGYLSLNPVGPFVNEAASCNLGDDPISTIYALGRFYRDNLLALCRSSFVSSTLCILKRFAYS